MKFQKKVLYARCSVMVLDTLCNRSFKGATVFQPVFTVLGSFSDLPKNIVFCYNCLSSVWYKSIVCLRQKSNCSKSWLFENLQRTEIFKNCHKGTKLLISSNNHVLKKTLFFTV